MPRRSPKSSSGKPHAVILLAVVTLLLFVGGEALVLARTDSGRLTAARYLGVGDPARITMLVGKQIRRGLEAAGVPRDSVRETVSRAEGRPKVRWRVGLKPTASLLETNYAITRAVEEQGGVVLSGLEHPGTDGALEVELRIGLPRRPTHEVRLVRLAAPATAPPPAGRLALVLYGFEEDADSVAKLFGLPLPFAVALPAGGEKREKLYRAAHSSGREIVLQVPLEPINYPQVDPGPGTILVSMKPARITGLLRHYLDQASPVAAVANHMGSLATQDMEAMRAFYAELRRRHLPFLHVASAAGSVCKPLAAEVGIEYDEPDAMLDLEARGSDPKALNARWTAMIKRARLRGGAIVLVRVTPLARQWLPGALSPKRLDGVSIVPLTTVLRHPGVLSSELPARSSPVSRS